MQIGNKLAKSQFLFIVFLWLSVSGQRILVCDSEIWHVVESFGSLNW